jgi:hypothetical protein
MIGDDGLILLLLLQLNPALAERTAMVRKWSYLDA